MIGPEHGLGRISSRLGALGLVNRNQRLWLEREAPSYAPTTDTYAPTMAPTATGVPTFTDAPTGAPTNATNTTTSRRLEATVPLPVSKSFHRSGGAHTEVRRRLQALSS